MTKPERLPRKREDVTKQDDDLEALLDDMCAGMSAGQRALEALLLYRASLLPVPEQTMSTIADCYSLFIRGAPPSGWTQEEIRKSAPKTLGEAFQTPDIKDGKNANAKRMRAVLLPQVWAAFNGPTALPKSERSYEDVAARLGITVDQVRRMALVRQP